MSAWFKIKANRFCPFFNKAQWNDAYDIGEYTVSPGPPNRGSEMNQARIYQNQAQLKGMSTELPARVVNSEKQSGSCLNR